MNQARGVRREHLHAQPTAGQSRVTEIRNACLLKNSDALGEKVEGSFQLPADSGKGSDGEQTSERIQGYFEMMEKQKLPPEWPFLKKPLPKAGREYITSHRTCLDALYGIMLLFWAIAAVLLAV